MSLNGYCMCMYVQYTFYIRCHFDIAAHVARSSWISTIGSSNCCQGLHPSVLPCKNIGRQYPPLVSSIVVQRFVVFHFEVKDLHIERNRFDQILRKKNRVGQMICAPSSFSVWSKCDPWNLQVFFWGGQIAHRSHPWDGVHRFPSKGRFQVPANRSHLCKLNVKLIFSWRPAFTTLYAPSTVCFPHVSTISLEIRGLHFWGNLSIVQRYDRYACDQSHNSTFVTDPLVAWTKGVDRG